MPLHWIYERCPWGPVVLPTIVGRAVWSVLLRFHRKVTYKIVCNLHSGSLLRLPHNWQRTRRADDWRDSRDTSCSLRKRICLRVDHWPILHTVKEKRYRPLPPLLILTITHARYDRYASGYVCSLSLLFSPYLLGLMFYSGTMRASQPMMILL